MTGTNESQWQRPNHTVLLFSFPVLRIPAISPQTPGDFSEPGSLAFSCEYFYILFIFCSIICGI